MVFPKIALFQNSHISPKVIFQIFLGEFPVLRFVFQGNRSFIPFSWIMDGKQMAMQSLNKHHLQTITTAASETYLFCRTNDKNIKLISSNIGFYSSFRSTAMSGRLASYTFLRPNAGSIAARIRYSTHTRCWNGCTARRLTAGHAPGW